MKIYYAHCLNIYHSEQEKRDIKSLESLGFEVINPADNKIDKSTGKCTNDKIKFIKINELIICNYCDIMSFCLLLVRNCEALAFRSLPDGSITSGVYREIEEAIKYNKTVIELPSFALRKILSIEETVGYLKEIGQR